MATYSSHRLIMGKEEIDNFFYRIGDIWKKKLQECLLSSSPCCIGLLSKMLNLIGLRGDIKGKFSKKYSKFFFSETVRRMNLKIGILALDIALYKSYDFYSG